MTTLHCLDFVTTTKMTDLLTSPSFTHAPSWLEDTYDFFCSRRTPFKWSRRLLLLSPHRSPRFSRAPLRALGACPHADQRLAAHSHTGLS